MGTLFSFFMVAFSWYSTSLIWQWQKLSVTFCVGSSVIGSSLMRIGGILNKAYSVGWKNTLVFSTLVLAPVANMVLKNLAYRLQAKDETKVLIRVSVLMALAHIGVGAILLILDAAMLKSVFSGAMLE